MQCGPSDGPIVCSRADGHHAADALVTRRLMRVRMGTDKTPVAAWHESCSQQCCGKTVKCHGRETQGKSGGDGCCGARLAAAARVAAWTRMSHCRRALVWLSTGTSGGCKQAFCQLGSERESRPQSASADGHAQQYNPARAVCRDDRAPGG